MFRFFWRKRKKSSLDLTGKVYCSQCHKKKQPQNRTVFKRHNIRYVAFNAEITKETATHGERKRTKTCKLRKHQLNLFQKLLEAPQRF